MKYVLTLGQYLLESSDEENHPKNFAVHSLLLKNKNRIKDLANVDDLVFDKVLNDLSENPPISIEEEDLISDAVKMCYVLKPDALPFMKLDQGDRLTSQIIGNTEGKSGVAIQNYDNHGPTDSQSY